MRKLKTFLMINLSVFAVAALAYAILTVSHPAFAEDIAPSAEDSSAIGEECHCVKEMPSSAIPNQPPEIFIDPAFANVKQVILVVNTTPSKYRTEEGQEQLPSPLRQEHLEATLNRLYTERFRKPECMAIPNCYNKENQPVTVMQATASESRKEIERLSSDPGTLFAFLQVNLIDEKRLGIEGDAKLISVHLQNFRSGDVSPFFQTALPISFTDEVSEKNLSKWIEGYISMNISR